VTYIGDDPTMSLDIYNKLWDHGQDELEVSPEMIGEKQVYESVEVGVRADSQDNEKVPKHCDEEKINPNCMNCMFENADSSRKGNSDRNVRF
jgi:hypothetical protein